MNIFEQASRKCLRFKSNIGDLNVEQLWDLPLTTTKANGVSLDNIARAIHKKLETTDISFVQSPSRETGELRLQMDIVKHIIDVRLKENQAAVDAKHKADRKAKLQEIIERKREDELGGKSIEELEAELKSLDD